VIVERPIGNLDRFCRIHFRTNVFEILIEDAGFYKLREILSFLIGCLNINYAAKSFSSNLASGMYVTNMM
jgi:hypothetical protein